MPIFTSKTMTTQRLRAGFSFSGTRVTDLAATEYTLVGVAADTSSSVAPFAGEIESCIKEVVTACRRSPRADNLMLRLVTFSRKLEEVHGFVPLVDCPIDSYTDAVRCEGTTALYDAATTLVESVGAYGKTLCDADFDVNGIVFVITDGADNASKQSAADLGRALERVRRAEHVESLVSVLVGVNVADPQLDAYLSDLAQTAGFTRYLPIGDANASSLARLAQFVSRSISAQSMALGTGASQPIGF
ncbi:MAG: hypothetical protein KDK70_21810 [Myxococcales bacterium]|nr:hypothetical protein [Myxococcales bacterium]